MRLPPTLFHSDPQSFEVITGWSIAAVGIWIWPVTVALNLPLFGGLFPHLGFAHGWEALAGTTLILIGIRHGFGAHSTNLKDRSRRALFMAWVIMLLALLIGSEQGWDRLGIPVAMVASLAQVWVFARHKGWI